MTWKGRPDPSLGQWWEGIAELILERTRNVAAAADDVDGMGDRKLRSAADPWL
jgi:hypothetical protein